MIWAVNQRGVQNMIDVRKTGKFIAQCRHEKNLTQKELGDRLNVTDRAVSKWENGRSFPDVNLIEEICRELDIEVSELLAGKKIEPEHYKEETEKMLMGTVRENTMHRFQLIIYLLMTLPFVLILLPILWGDPVWILNVLFWPEGNVLLLKGRSILLIGLIIVFMWCGSYLERYLPEKNLRHSSKKVELFYATMGAAWMICSVGAGAVINGIKAGGIEGIAAAGIGTVITVRYSIINFKRAIETARANKEKYEEENPEKK